MANKSSIDAERLPEVEEFDDFVLSVTNPQTGAVMRVYLDGQIEGFPPGFTLVENHIQEIVRRAAELGYIEAETRIVDARRSMYMRLIGELKDRYFAK